MAVSAKDRLSRLLDFLAAADLAGRGERSDELQRAALSYGTVERLPIVFSWPRAPDSPFPPLPNADIYRDPAAMLYNELVSAWDLGVVDRFSGGGLDDDLAPTIRPNWGTVLVASVLGGEAEQADGHTPWIRRRDDRPVPLEEIAEADPDPASSGWMPRAVAAYQAYRELLAPWPELGRALRVTLPDLQGPLDTLEQLAGAELLADLIERPEPAARALRRAAEVQVACARLLAPLVRDGPDGLSHQHGFLVRGGVLLRDDSAVMISPELYRDVVAPADELALSALGGGGIHSCGRIAHAVPAMLALESLRCVDFGQSFMNDVDALYGLARLRRVPLLRVQPARGELLDGSILRRFPTGVSLLCPADSAEDARRLLDGYREACAAGRAGR